MIKRRSTVFYKYLMSYIFLCSFPVVFMGVFLYQNSVLGLKKEVEKSSISKLAQTQSMIELQVREFRNIAFRISQDPAFMRYRLKDDVYNQIQAVDELKKFKANSSVVNDVFLYFRNQNKIYTTDGFYSYADFAKYFYRDTAWHPDQFYAVINHISQPRVLNVTEKLPGSKVPAELAFLYPIQPQSPNPHGTVAFIVPKEILSSTLQNMLGDFKGDSYILDGDQHILTSVHHGAVSFNSNLAAILQKHSGQSVFKLSFHGKSYTFIVKKSDTIGWSFVNIIPTSQFLSHVIQKRDVIIEIIALILLIGMGAAFAFSLYHYRPIRNLVEQLQPDGLKYPKKTAHENELQFIEHAVEDFTNRQREIYRDRLLYRLLSGNIHGRKDLEEGIVRSRLEFSVIGCFVFLMETSDSQFLSKYRKFLDQTKHNAYCIDAPNENSTAVIVNIPQTGIVSYAAITDTLDWVHRDSNVKVYIGVGGVYQDPLQLNRSYIEASAALEYKMIAGGKEITYFHDLADVHNKEHWYPVQEQIVYLHSLKQGDSSLALENLNGILHSLSVKGSSLLMLRYICFDIVNSTIKTVKEINEHHFNDIIEKLMAFSSFDELYQHLEQLTLEVCKYVEGIKKSKNMDLKNQVLQYIHAHFKDHAISLEMIADLHQVSVSFLSRFFKEQTGRTFTGYLSALRMEEAKRQLIQSEKSIGEIVKEVGYLDIPNFVRKFRKTEGVTPGQYRLLYISENSGD